jgi:gamma-glutamylcyclotransferase (GGCT)/AIG2-like uncharacterized protein YtfP
MTASLYFAYGSNLNRAQVAARCPGAVPLHAARLDGYRLRFRGWSPRWEGAPATVEPRPRAAVWGALYRMTAGDWPQLDRAEGPAYVRRPVAVTDPRSGEALAAETYVMLPGRPAGTPSDAYLRRMLDGARTWGLPDAYVDSIVAAASPRRPERRSRRPRSG